MKKKQPSVIEQLWEKAEANRGSGIALGSTVVCDICDVDYTDRDDKGGFIFTSSAYCPACAEEGLASIKGFGEEHFIRARCPEGVEFRVFVIGYRGVDAELRITTL